MDPTLSLYMANQALVQPGDFVFDPFVGTGSLLVAAAKQGGKVLTTKTSFLDESLCLNYSICIFTLLCDRLQPSF